MDRTIQFTETEIGLLNSIIKGAIIGQRIAVETMIDIDEEYLEIINKQTEVLNSIIFKISDIN